MSIESKIPVEELNIKQLSLEQPESVDGFDFEKLASLVNWEKLQEALRGENENMDEVEKKGARESVGFPESLYRIKELSPSTSENICNMLGIDENFYDPLIQKEIAGREYQSGRNTEKIWTAIGLKYLFPNKDLGMDLSADSWGEMVDTLNSERNFGNYQYHFVPKLAVAMKTLFPQRQGAIILKDDDWKGMEKELEKYKSHDAINEYFIQMSYMKLLFPGRIKDLPPITAMDIQEIRQSINSEDENQNWEHIIELLYALKILASEKVEFVNGRMEITMPEKTNLHQANTLPEVKKF